MSEREREIDREREREREREKPRRDRIQYIFDEKDQLSYFLSHVAWLEKRRHTIV